MISLEYAEFFLQMLKKHYKALSKLNYRILKNVIYLNRQYFFAYVEKFYKTLLNHYYKILIKMIS